MLTKRYPNMIATRLICLACGGEMPLKLVESAYDGRPVNTHVFRCSNCHLNESYLFPWIKACSKDGLRSMTSGKSAPHGL